MSISYSLSKHLVFVHILTLQLLTRSVSSLNLTNAYLHHKCLDKKGKYQPGSEFEKDLNDMTEAVHATLKEDSTVSSGTGPNAVTIIIHCRGDSYGSRCRSCFATAVSGLRRRCQRNKAAKIWYDQCYLYISQDDLTSKKVDKIDYENTFSMQNPNNVKGDTKSFNNKTMDFLHKLTQKAQVPKGNKIEFYAAEEERIGANNLYAMVLCTQTFGDCEACLKSAIKELSKCCSGKQGARVYMGTSCNLRYELYPFLSK